VKRTADNYLDFQLATYLGHLISSTEETEFFIVSRDRDYEAVQDFWTPRRHNVAIVLCESIKASFEDNGATVTGTTDVGVKVDSKAKKIASVTAKTTRKTPSKVAVKVVDGGSSRSVAKVATKAIDGGVAKVTAKEILKAVATVRPNEGEKTIGTAKSNGTTQMEPPKEIRNKIKPIITAEMSGNRIAGAAHRKTYEIFQAAKKATSNKDHSLRARLKNEFGENEGNLLYEKLIGIFGEYQKTK
jgi:hypothetical protein